MTGNALLFERDLTAPLPAPVWPERMVRLPFDAESARAAHTLLQDAYSNGFGAVAPFAEWHAALRSDNEYDAQLCFLHAADAHPVAFAQVWTSGFIKDFVVAEGFRRKGVGKALLLSVFMELQMRGLQTVRLKVVDGNMPAINLYAACGMAPVAD